MGSVKAHCYPGRDPMNPVRSTAALLALCLPAAASVIFTTHGSPPTFSTDPANAWQIAQSPSTFTTVAESFTPASAFDLGEVDLPVEFVSGTTNAFTLKIESGASQPTTVVETLTSAGAASAVLVAVNSITHPHLNAGTKYWIVVTTTGDTAVEWFVDPINPRGVSLQTQGSGSWTNSSGSTKGSVQLLSALSAPEPTTAALLAAGAALLIAAKTLKVCTKVFRR